MSWASSEASRRIMQANRRRDTGPELAVRRLLHARGLRYRVDLAVEGSIRSRPDIVFTRRRIAIYVDGCFWHGCPQHRTLPRANADYWTPKLQTNIDRDARVTGELRAAGWTVLRFWEHEDPSAVASVIIEAVTGAQPSEGPWRSPGARRPD